MRKVTAITVFETSAGTRLSIVYSEISEEGVITKDNIRTDRIIVASDAQAHADGLMEYAQEIINGMEG